MTKQAIVYVRISRDREGASLGVSRQEADCRELAQRLGWSVVAVHSDNDISAYSGKVRPGYRALLTELRAGRANAVIAWHPDRLHRRVAELEEFVSVCEDNDVAIQTVRAGEVDLSTASGRMIARMLGAAAQHEIDHSRERIQRAKAQAAADGRWRGGRRPFGYLADGVTVEPNEARALELAASEVLAGRSLIAVARALTERGFTTTAGKPMDAIALRRVLLRARNAGLIEMHGQISGPAEWPAIIPEEQWRAVRAMLTAPGRRTTTGPERKWLGSGLYRCGVCGDICRATMAGRQVKSYTCRAKKCVVRRVDQVDEFVLKVIAARLERDDLAEALASKAGAPDMEALQTEAVATRVRLDELAEMFAAGHVSAAQLRAGSERMRAELERIEDTIVRAKTGGVLTSLAGEANPSAAFLAAPLDKQRAVVDALATVTLLPATKGRPAGWRQGDPYFQTSTVQITPKEAS